MQIGAKEAALRTPFQGDDGCGSRQRKLPTGGLAYGTPL
jgi:hypothetical protein